MGEEYNLESFCAPLRAQGWEIYNFNNISLYWIYHANNCGRNIILRVSVRPYGRRVGKYTISMILVCTGGDRPFVLSASDPIGQADDVALVSNRAYKLQGLLSLAMEYADAHHVTMVPEKGVFKACKNLGCKLQKKFLQLLQQYFLQHLLVVEILLPL